MFWKAPHDEIAETPASKSWRRSLAFIRLDAREGEGSDKQNAQRLLHAILSALAFRNSLFTSLPFLQAIPAIKNQEFQFLSPPPIFEKLGIVSLNLASRLIPAPIITRAS